MKAVVMAGGEGSRLRPLTGNRPKPLVPVANKPVMQHILELLQAHDITDVVVTLHYLASEIESFFGDGSDFGMNIAYTVEDTPLGTAGSVKKAEALLQDEPFLIISGDAITDIDLTRVIEFHRAQGSMATLTLVRVADPLEFGVVITDEDGRIRRFLEKPGWSQVFSDTVNTGIYCLDPAVFKLMEPDKVYDWSKDIFPRLLQDHHPLFGYLASQYWCDIGSLLEYRRAQSDVLRGKVKVQIPGEQRADGVWVDEGAEIDGAAQLHGPLLIGKNARVKAGAVIEECSVVGDGCVIGSNAHLLGATVWNGVYIGDSARLEDCIIGRNTVIDRDTRVSEGAVIGDRCHLSRGSRVAPHVKIWPDKTVESGAQVTMSLIRGERWSRSLFKSCGVCGLANVELTPEFAAKLGGAYGAIVGRGARVTAGRDPHPASRMLKQALIAGLTSAGARVDDLQSLPAPLSRFAVHSSHARAGAYARICPEHPGCISIELTDADGIALGKDAQRKLEGIFYREDFRRADAWDVGTSEYLSRTTELYVNGLMEFVDAERVKAAGFRVWLDCAYGSTAYVIPQIFGRLGCHVVTLNPYPDAAEQPRTSAQKNRFLADLAKLVTTVEGHMGALIDDEGESLFLVDERGRVLSHDKLLTALCLLLFRSSPGSSVAVPLTAPSVIEDLAAAHNGRVVRAGAELHSLMVLAARERAGLDLAADAGGHFILPGFQPGLDAVAALAKLMELLARQDMTLSMLADAVPPFFLEHRIVPCPWERKGEVMRRLAEETATTRGELTEGVRVAEGTGWVYLLPDAAEPAFHLYAEAGSQQELQRLTQRYAEHLQAMAGNGA